YLARFDAQRGAIPGVQAHTDHLVPLSAQFVTCLDSVAYAFDGVIGVDEKDAVVRHCFGIRLKRFALVFEKHDPTVRLRSAHRNAELLSCLQIGCAGTTADISGTSCRQSAIHSLRAAQTKLDHRITFGSQADTRGFCGNKALEIENVEQGRLE